MTTKQFDPRAVLVMVFALSGLAVWLTSLRELAVLVLVTLGILQLLHGDWRVLYRLRRLLGVFGLVVVLQSVFGSHGGTIVQLGSLALLSESGLTSGLVLLTRVGIIMLSASLLMQCNPRTLIQGLIQWKVPYELAFMVMLAIRFLPLLREELRDTFVAIQLRGIELDTLSLSKRFSLFSYLFFPVLTSVIWKAQRIATGLEMRAFRAFPTRTSHFTLELSWPDYGVMSLAAAIFVSFIFLV